MQNQLWKAAEEVQDAPQSLLSPIPVPPTVVSITLLVETGDKRTGIYICIYVTFHNK
jgi:hypothetical protein